MDNLFRQTRIRFSGIGQEKKEESDSGRDQISPPQKTQSFKDKKKEQNWFRRQFSRQMSRDYDGNNGDEQAIAVAAAAYAIGSLQESGTPDQKQAKDVPRTSTMGSKSKKEDRTISFSEPGRDYKRFSESPDNMVPVTAADDAKKPEKASHHAPSFRKTPSSVDEQPTGSSEQKMQPTGSFKQSSGSFKRGSGELKPDLPTGTKPARTPSSADMQTSSSLKPGSSTSKPGLPTTPKPALPPAETRRQSSTRQGMEKSQSDVWEEAELARITERYEKQQSTILSWEDNKKKKAKRRLDKQEKELESKRAKALQRYRNKTQYIDQAVGGARTKAEEKKRNDVIKVKEKANVIRRTGKVPKTCFCF